MNKIKWNKFSKNILLIVLLFILLYPVFFLLIGSIMGLDEITLYLRPAMANISSMDSKFVKWPMFLPNIITFESILKVLIDTPEFFHMFWNSTTISIGILLGQILVSIPCAWGLSQAKWTNKHKDRIMFIYIFLMLVPFQVTMLPTYLVIDRLNLINSFYAIILPSIFNTMPIYIIYNFFNKIPVQIIEASQMDGASNIQIFFKVGIPLTRSGISAALLLSYIETWNLIEQPLLFLTSQDKWPLSLQLPNISLEKADVAIVSSVIALILPMLILLYNQNELEQGIASSAMRE